MFHELPFSIIDIITMVGAVVCLIIICSHLIVHKARMYRYGIIFFDMAFAAVQLGAILLFNRNFGSYHVLIVAVIQTLIFSCGPSYSILFLRKLFGVTFRVRQSIFVHYLPSVISGMVSIPMVIMCRQCDIPFVNGRSILELSGFTIPNIITVMLIVSCTHTALYMLLFVILHYKTIVARDLRKERHLFHGLIFIGMIFVNASMTAVMIAAGLTNAVRICLCSTALCFCWVITIAQKYPVLLQLKSPDRKSVKKKTHLAGDDVEHINSALAGAMDIEKAYRDEGLTLNKLAAIISSTPHQLSEYLNDYLEKSFNDYVNEYRIEEATRMLLDEPERTVISIGFDVGFQSQSTFYASFQRIIGTSPGSYRKQKLNNPTT